MEQNTDPDIDAMLKQAEIVQAQAKDIALQHIQEYAPFVGMTSAVRAREIRDFDVIARTGSVFREEMTEMLARDLTAHMSMLTAQVLAHPQINSVRLAVLAHVAMVIGQDNLLKCRLLWDAISSKQWDDAQDALLMTKWPEQARSDEDRRRVLELARMMRTGVVPMAWMKKIH